MDTNNSFYANNPDIGDTVIATVTVPAGNGSFYSFGLPMIFYPPKPRFVPSKFQWFLFDDI
jgi:hypothetical protein